MENTSSSWEHSATAAGGNSAPPSIQLTAAQQRATYRSTWTRRNGKPEFIIPTGNVINFNSAFGEKGLCTGPTFTAGLACHFSCTYCYVGSQLSRNPSVLRIIKETGLAFDQMVIVKEEPLPVLRGQLFDSRDRLRKLAQGQHVIFGSPLVDVAANHEAAKRTIEICRFLFEHTNWEIRLLSKSALLQRVAEALHGYKDRLILGFSTGTLNEDLAGAIEKGTSRVSARVKALHWLQDQGYRTYGMICPILPYVNVDDSIVETLNVLRVQRMEHVWAEVLNARGNSRSRTVAALSACGFPAQANMLEHVSSDRSAWENYARETFLALTRRVPPEKLRFLQYVQPGQQEWWRALRANGAVLLGSHA